MKTADEITEEIVRLEGEKARIGQDVNPNDSDIVKRNARLAVMKVHERIDALRWVLDSLPANVG